MILHQQTASASRYILLFITVLLNAAIIYAGNYWDLIIAVPLLILAYYNVKKHQRPVQQLYPVPGYLQLPASVNTRHQAHKSRAIVKHLKKPRALVFLHRSHVMIKAGDLRGKG
jgi:hypothetical protein